MGTKKRKPPAPRKPQVRKVTPVRKAAPAKKATLAKKPTTTRRKPPAVERKKWEHQTDVGLVDQAAKVGGIVELLASPLPKRGRPKKAFDLRAVEQLARLGCTDEEIATVLGCSRRTVESRKADGDDDFRSAYKKGRAELATALRLTQVRLALGGNTTMLVWLGKQFLGQRDRFDGSVEIPAKPRDGVLLPASLPETEHAAVVAALRKQGKLPGDVDDDELFEELEGAAGVN